MALSILIGSAEFSSWFQPHLCVRTVRHESENFFAELKRGDV